MPTRSIGFGENTDGTGLKMTYCIPITNASSSVSQMQRYIPAYSRIDNVRISIQYKTSLSTKGDCRYYLEADTDSYFDAGGYRLNPLFQTGKDYLTCTIDKNSTIDDSSIRLTDMFNSMKSNAGAYSGSKNLCIWFSATITRKWYWKSSSFSIDYTEPSCTVSVYSNGGGTVSGAGTYAFNYSYTITATPNAGYRFVSWSDGNTNASRTISVNAALINAFNTTKSYTATFEKIPDTTPPVITSVSITPNPATCGQGVVVAVKLTD